MPDLLIALGGTGQHLALAVSRLVFLGALPEMELAVVDADDQQELSESLMTFGRTVEANYTSHPLINPKIYNPFDKMDIEDPQFQELMISANSSPAQRELFEVCFEEESARLKVNEGMYGRPSVGSTVFVLNKEKQMEPVFERAELATRIFITGSMVGGTGAGLIHQVIKTLATGASASTRKFGLIFLRWFGVPRDAVKQTINDATLDRNMRYGLDYFFKDTRPLLKASLLIGIPDNPPDDLTAPILLSAGNTTEKKHYVHLAAAYGIVKLPQIAVTEQTDGSIFAAAHDSDNPKRLYEEEWNGQKLHWYVNRGYYVKELLDYVCSPRFKEAMLDAFGLLGKPKNIGQGLYDAINYHDRKQRKTIVDEIVHTWALLSKQYRFSLSWFDEVLKEALPKKLHHPQYTNVRDNETEKVKDIQTCWAEPFVMGPEKLTGPEIARTFHRKIVDRFA
jgi:hypothetical protein